MNQVTQKELLDIVHHTQQVLIALSDLRKQGNLIDATGIYEMLAAVGTNSLSTSVLVLQLILKLDLTKGAPGEPVIVGTDASASVCTIPPAGWRCTREAGHEGPCAAVEDNTLEEAQTVIMSEDKEPCGACEEYPDPEPGIAIRLCPECGRRIPRNRR